MIKKVTCIVICLVTLRACACGGTVFDGSRTGNESRLIMDFEVLNKTDFQKLTLAAGDIVDFNIVNKAGSIDISLQKDGEEPVYEETDVQTSSFQVQIYDGGTYTVSVTGKKARGSVSITKADPDTETQ